MQQLLDLVQPLLAHRSLFRPTVGYRRPPELSSVQHDMGFVNGLRAAPSYLFFRDRPQGLDRLDELTSSSIGQEKKLDEQDEDLNNRTRE